MLFDLRSQGILVSSLISIKCLTLVQNSHSLLEVCMLKKYPVWVCKTLPVASPLFLTSSQAENSLNFLSPPCNAHPPCLLQNCLLLWPHTLLPHLTRLYPTISSILSIISPSRLIHSVSSTPSFPVAIIIPSHEDMCPVYPSLSPLASHLRVHCIWNSSRTPAPVLLLWEDPLTPQNEGGSERKKWEREKLRRGWCSLYSLCPFSTSDLYSWKT